MRSAMVAEIIGVWEIKGETDPEPSRRATFRECADTLRMLLDSEAEDPLPNAMWELLSSAKAISDRKGEGTAWERFSNSCAKLGITGVTARVYRLLPSDTAPEAPQAAASGSQAQQDGQEKTAAAAALRRSLVAWHTQQAGWHRHAASFEAADKKEPTRSMLLAAAEMHERFAALAAAAPVELSIREAPPINYKAAIYHCHETLGHAQGTKGCIAFAKGAEWYRALVVEPSLQNTPGHSV